MSGQRRAEFQRRAREQLLFDLAVIDMSLGCFNRAYLVHRAREEIARRARYGQRLSVLLLEADRRLPGAPTRPAREPAQGDRRRRPAGGAADRHSGAAGRPVSCCCCCRAPDSPAPRASPAVCAPLSRPRRQAAHRVASPPASASRPRSAARSRWNCWCSAPDRGCSTRAPAARGSPASADAVGLVLWPAMPT